MELVPANRQTVLEIGSRHGSGPRALAERFENITALDLETPKFEIERVVTVKGGRVVSLSIYSLC